MRVPGPATSRFTNPRNRCKALPRQHNYLPLARAAAKRRAGVRGRRRVPQAQPRTRDGRGLTRDAFGSLTGVELPDGRSIEYVTDAVGRRIAKKVDGVVTQQWLYHNGLEPVAELDASGAVTAQFVYASKTHLPDYVVRSSGIYRVVSDQVGSVRLVVNITNASDVLFRGEYGAFGQLTVADGSLENASFGFAGGLYDADTGLVWFGARGLRRLEPQRWLVTSCACDQCTTGLRLAPPSFARCVSPRASAPTDPDRHLARGCRFAVNR